MTHPIPTAQFAATDLAIDNCWKRIGIQGDKSCPELARHSHCHNCPAFSLAAMAMLDRELPGEAQSGPIGWLGAAAAAEEDTSAESLMIFRLGKEWFALPTRVLDEIIALRPIHSLPHRRNPGLLGLVNVRGELVVCVSIAQLLIGASAMASPQGRLVVARHSAGRLAFPVDEVEHARHYSRNALQPLPATVARSPSSFTLGILAGEGKTIGRLDEGLLFEALDRSLT